MACIDVYHLWCSGCGTCGWWWEAASCFLHKTGNRDAVVLVDVVSVGSVVPFDVSKLAEV